MAKKDKSADRQEARSARTDQSQPGQSSNYGRGPQQQAPGQAAYPKPQQAPKQVSPKPQQVPKQKAYSKPQQVPKQVSPKPQQVPKQKAYSKPQQAPKQVSPKPQVPKQKVTPPARVPEQKSPPKSTQAPKQKVGPKQQQVPETKVRPEKAKSHGKAHSEKPPKQGAAIPKKSAELKKSDKPSKKQQNDGFSSKRAQGEPNRKQETKGEAAKKSKAMDLPGKRPDVQKGGASDKAQKVAKKAQDKDGGRGKAMQLPGKRPVVPGGEAKKQKARPDIAKSDKKTGDRTAVHKEHKQVKNKKAAVVRPGQNVKQVRHADLSRKGAHAWWDHGARVKNKNIQINNITNVARVNNNFRQNVNWSTRRHHWGYNPWWNRTAVRPWYGSTWNGGWNRRYYRHHYHYGRGYGYRVPGYYDDTARAIGWGLIGWSLGTLVYDTGYRVYHNPYPVRPVHVHNTTYVNYSEPITRVAARYAADDLAEIEDGTTKSETLIGESQAFFAEGDYLVALELADRAIAESPGDGALHEYRALILFALGKYGEAAGVLNPVLASGPGWEWSTMIALYDVQETYTDQLQRLESYTVDKPDAADAHFLLGYHYMVCGHLDLALPQFDLAYKLMPGDSVAKELAELVRASVTSEDDMDLADAEEEAGDGYEPAPVPLEKLTGVWVFVRNPGNTITLTFHNDGKFLWVFDHEGKASELTGEYSINDDGLLVLDSDESQIVATVVMQQESEMNLMLAGGPPADPGLAFRRN